MSLLDFSDPQNKDYTEKKYVPKILLIFPLPNIGASQKKKYVPKTQVTQVGKSFSVFKKFIISGVFLSQNQVPKLFGFMGQDPLTPLNGAK